MESASESNGSSISARATRTFSRAVWVSMPQAQLSQWAQDSAPCAAQTLAAVELGDEDKQPVRGGMDMGGESGDGGGQGVVVYGGEVIRGEGVCNSHGLKRRM